MTYTYVLEGLILKLRLFPKVGFALQSEIIESSQWHMHQAAVNVILLVCHQ